MVKNKRNKFGLSLKLILLIFTTVAAISAFIFYYIYNFSYNTIEKNLKENSKLLTTATVNQVEKILTGVKKIPDNLSAVLEGGNYTEEQLINFLKLVVETNDELYGSAIAFEPYAFKNDRYYFSPYVYKENGNISFVDLGYEDYHYFTMDWYQIPKELKRPLWSEPYFDDGGGNIIMTTYSVPLFKKVGSERKFVGILTADISLDWLQEIISEIKVYETGYAFLISKTGTIITHPNKDLIMNETIFSIASEMNNSDLREIGRRMIRGETSFTEIEYYNVADGKLSWISYAPVPINGWSIGIVYPVDEFNADINLLYRTILFIGIIGVFLLLVSIVLISRSITHPLRQLADATQKFGEGYFDVKLPKIKTNDEISELTLSFTAMQEALKRTINQLQIANVELEEYNRMLEDKVEERTLKLKEKNKALDRAFNNVKTLSEIGQKITSTLNLESILLTVYKSVNSLLDASSFLIMVVNEKEQTLECKLAIENDEKLPDFAYQLSDKNRFAVWSILNKKPVFMNDVDVDYINYIPERVKPKAGLYASSILYYPLIVENRIIGTISAQSFKKNAYTNMHLDILSTIASYTAVALDNAYAYEKINLANRKLQEAQAKLIQAEKMASLGQLTAGIAHEIKNPLNFINNFAELTSELSKEFNEEFNAHKDKFDENTLDYLISILNDIEHNAIKINEHGKRADSIIKGMLLHSRGKSGEFQKTNLNDLLDEYIKLAYHGYRAQDSSFNVKIETEYDSSLEPVNVVPQDISRVFLNIINNACYSTHEKKKELGDYFSPVLKVKTISKNNSVEVTIRDNGKGIPKDILDKIFNPFFTTKPTGKGTGLGLSLSFDIIVQEHKGDFKVNSEQGEFAEFIITIPKNL